MNNEEKMGNVLRVNAKMYMSEADKDGKVMLCGDGMTLVCDERQIIDKKKIDILRWEAYMKCKDVLTEGGYELFIELGVSRSKIKPVFKFIRYHIAFYIGLLFEDIYSIENTRYEKIVPNCEIMDCLEKDIREIDENVQFGQKGRVMMAELVNECLKIWLGYLIERRKLMNWREYSDYVIKDTIIASEYIIVKVN